MKNVVFGGMFATILSLSSSPVAAGPNPQTCLFLGKIAEGIMEHRQNGLSKDATLLLIENAGKKVWEKIAPIAVGIIEEAYTVDIESDEESKALTVLTFRDKWEEACQNL